jgi:hypothetical protein
MICNSHIAIIDVMLMTMMRDLKITSSATATVAVVLADFSQS